MMRVAILLPLIAGFADFRGDFNCLSNTFIPQKGENVYPNLLFTESESFAKTFSLQTCLNRQIIYCQYQGELRDV